MGRSSEHQRVQREGKKRDYETCCVCGNKEKPEGHHVIDYQYGGVPQLFALLSDFVVLTRTVSGI